MIKTSDKVLEMEDMPLTSHRAIEIMVRCYEIDVSSDVLLIGTDRFCHLTKKH